MSVWQIYLNESVKRQIIKPIPNWAFDEKCVNGGLDIMLGLASETRDHMFGNEGGGGHYFLCF